MRPSRLVRTAALCLSMGGCADPDPPSGLYVARCDPDATLVFEADNSVLTNVNYCEGYAVDDGTFEQDGDQILLPPSANPEAAPNVFEITEPGILTLREEAWNFTCGNCKPGDTWVLAE
ncbi:MAG: hypothetical protein HOV80_05635 [Polyangiaceae bacterium]|nr:hypothetical protein [Polyangiaceae bacterium]